jgi:hypothetical protein
MKKAVILLVIICLSGLTSSFSQVAKLKGRLSGKTSSETGSTQSLENSQESSTATFESNTMTYFSIDLGKAGMYIPAFIDLNSTPQGDYKIKSHDFMIQAAFEQKLAKSPIHGPFVFGIKEKFGIAYSYWLTQQGDGEPGNYFASNGSFTNAGDYLHSGDAINIGGLRWSFSPDLTAHYAIGSNLEVGAAIGPCLFGYTGMNIKDPWSGYSTSISNTNTVWHSSFLTHHLKSFSVTIDWSANIMLTAPGKPNKPYFEIGMNGNSFFYGIGLAHPIIKSL